MASRTVMKKTLLPIVLVLLAHVSVFATWSIILVDPKTHEIGIAAASCTHSCYGIGKIIPNVGAIMVQAMSNSQARDKGIHMILAEASPEQIIEAMRAPVFDPERQQYAVVTIRYLDNPKIYTGTSTKPSNGGLTDYGISVQGNTLASDAVLQEVMSATQKGRNEARPLPEILMMALEAGARAGGDSRCGEQRATTAFLIAARPDDKKPYLDLLIFGQGRGKQNAVELLRIKYERWKRKHA
jgi:uncharacterized Ntn-hydrolase superfamily protein